MKLELTMEEACSIFNTMKLELKKEEECSLFNKLELTKEEECSLFNKLEKEISLLKGYCAENKTSIKEAFGEDAVHLEQIYLKLKRGLKQ